MVALLMLCNLFGCKKTENTAKHGVSELSTVGISCGHMDMRYGYSFVIHKENGIWLFDANCFTQNYEIEANFENQEISDEDIQRLYRILEENGSIVYAENYVEPKRKTFNASDKETYGFCLTFSDGNQYITFDRQSKLEEFFYVLAEKYNSENK